MGVSGHRTHSTYKHVFMSGVFTERVLFKDSCDPAYHLQFEYLDTPCS